MQIELEQHEDMFLILPSLAVTHGECSNPECAANHWRFSFGWIIWSAHLAF